MTVEVVQFICLNDNFGLLVHDAQSGATASIDAPDGAAIAAAADGGIGGVLWIRERHGRLAAAAAYWP